MTRSYGKNYDQALSVVDVASRIRSAIKTKVASGELPSDYKYSVRTRKYSGGASIDVDVTVPEPLRLMSTGWLYPPKGVDEWKVDLPVKGKMTPCIVRSSGWCITVDDVCDARRQKATKVLKALLDSYNYDGSDIMTDYFDTNFCGLVQFRSAKGIVETVHPWPVYQAPVSA